MKILVLGATGATGRLIVGKAVAKGYEVVALVRSKAKAMDLIGAELIEGDARDPGEQTRLDHCPADGAQRQAGAR